MLSAILFVLILFGFYGNNLIRKGFNEEALSISQCNVVKGYCILLVFISHSNQYLINSGYNISTFGDALYFRMMGAIGQLMVVMFLFFSGYGIMESYKKRGKEYVASMPKKRILATLLNFDVAVLSYVALNFLIGKSMTINQIFFSFIAWDSVGNSNWYIFCILLCYLISYFVFILYVRQQPIHSIVFLLTLFVLFIIVVFCLSFLKRSWWYNTMLCFPFGMLYSMMKGKINSLFHANYIKCLSLLVLAFLVFRYIPFSLRGFLYNMESMTFSLIIVLIMMKTELNNKYLIWMGQKLFPLYIYQRLMMSAIYEIPAGKAFIALYPLWFIIICLSTVLMIAYYYPKWQVKIHT